MSLIKMMLVMVSVAAISKTFGFLFFQAEDGILDGTGTGVQTCALPILDALSDGRTRCDSDFVRRSLASGQRRRRARLGLPAQHGLDAHHRNDVRHVAG